MACDLRFAQIREAAQFTLKAKAAFEKKGYQVQTIRIATQPWERYAISELDILDGVRSGGRSACPGH